MHSKTINEYGHQQQNCMSFGVNDGALEVGGQTGTDVVLNQDDFQNSMLSNYTNENSNQNRKSNLPSTGSSSKK